MLLIYTVAFNAEQTFRRTADSVFSQTRGDWLWYVVDNGSTDSTGALIQEIAKRDKRVISLVNEKNHVWNFGNNQWSDVIQAHKEEDFFCWLDADDVLKPEFLEKMLDFALKNRLDIAVCGSDHLDARTLEPRGARILNSDLLVEKEGFSQYFIVYHQFMRTYWAKLFSLSVMCRYDVAHVPWWLPYGWDTLFTQEMFRNATRVGILAEPLFDYYVSAKSMSRQWKNKRIESDRYLYQAALDFLVAKCGSVSPRNEEVLLIIYMNAIQDTLNVLVKAEIPEADKLSGVLDIFSHEYTQQAAARENIGALLGNVEDFTRRRRELFSSATTWLLSCREVLDERIEAYCDAGVFVSAIAGNGGAWVFFKKLRARLFVDRNRPGDARAEVDELAELLPLDQDVTSLKQQLACLSGHSDQSNQTLV